MKARYQKSLKKTQDSDKEDPKTNSEKWTSKSKPKSGKSERVQCFVCKKFHQGNCRACINCKNVKCSCNKRPATEDINGQWASKVQKINRYRVSIFISDTYESKMLLNFATDSKFQFLNIFGVTKASITYF